MALNQSGIAVEKPNDPHPAWKANPIDQFWAASCDLLIKVVLLAILLVATIWMPGQLCRTTRCKTLMQWASREVRVACSTIKPPQALKVQQPNSGHPVPRRPPPPLPPRTRRLIGFPRKKARRLAWAQFLFYRRTTSS